MTPQRILPGIWHAISGKHVFCWFDGAFLSASHVVNRFLTPHGSSRYMLAELRHVRFDLWRKR